MTNDPTSVNALNLTVRKPAHPFEDLTAFSFEDQKNDGRLTQVKDLLIIPADDNDSPHLDALPLT